MSFPLTFWNQVLMYSLLAPLAPEAWCMNINSNWCSYREWIGSGWITVLYACILQNVTHVLMGRDGFKDTERTTIAETKCVWGGLLDYFQVSFLKRLARVANSRKITYWLMWRYFRSWSLHEDQTRGYFVSMPIETSLLGKFSCPISSGFLVELLGDLAWVTPFLF